MTEKRFKLDSEVGFIDTQKCGGDTMTHFEVVVELNNFHEENEQLKQRNNNQYNQLNQLWQLIEAKDWETLTAMNNQMKKDEERLQREWKYYE